MRKVSVLIYGMMFLLLILFCTEISNPFTDPANAKISTDSSLKSVGDSLKAFSTVQCTVSLFLPELIDSFYIHRITASTDSIFAAGKVSSTTIVFPFSSATSGTNTIKIVIVKTDKSRDSLTRSITIFAKAPTITYDSTAYHVILPLAGDTFSFAFTVTDPDSNMRIANTWIDTQTSTMQTATFAGLKPYHQTVTRKIDKTDLLSHVNIPLVCHAYALDADSFYSGIATCTLYVKDTTKPLIVLISSDSVASLPFTIKANVTDLVGIESISFNGSVMTLVHDTATYSTSSIDTGKHTDSLIAIDKAGNKSKLDFSLTYHGKQVFTPVIKDLNRANTEGHFFDTLFLDTCVTFKDPAITDPRAYAKSNLKWDITDSANNQIGIPASHKFVIPQPADTEWAGTIKLTFVATDTLQKRSSDPRPASFFLTEVPDPPVITLGTQLSIGATANFSRIYLDTITTVRDPDNALSSLDWTFKNGKHFKVDSIKSTILIGNLSKTSTNTVSKTSIGSVIKRPLFFTRHIDIIPITASDSTWLGNDTLTFMVKDPTNLADTNKIIFSRIKTLFF